MRRAFVSFSTGRGRIDAGPVERCAMSRRDYQLLVGFLAGIRWISVNNLINTNRLVSTQLHDM